MAIQLTPARKARRQAALRREEERWARRSGPVTTRQATPEELAALKAKKKR